MAFCLNCLPGLSPFVLFRSRLILSELLTLLHLVFLSLSSDSLPSHFSLCLSLLLSHSDSMEVRWRRAGVKSLFYTLLLACSQERACRDSCLELALVSGVTPLELAYRLPCRKVAADWSLRFFNHHHRRTGELCGGTPLRPRQGLTGMWRGHCVWNEVYRTHVGAHIRKRNAARGRCRGKEFRGKRLCAKVGSRGPDDCGTDEGSPTLVHRRRGDAGSFEYRKSKWPLVAHRPLAGLSTDAQVSREWTVHAAIAVVSAAG